MSGGGGGGEKNGGGLYSCKSRGVRSTRKTRNTDPFKPRTDESLALCHLYLQQRCRVHPHHPACVQQNGENFPIGADPSGSFFTSFWNKRLPIVRLWFLYKLHPSWVTRLVCAYTGEKNYGPRTPSLCSLSLDLVTGKLYTLESCLLGSTQRVTLRVYP